MSGQANNDLSTKEFLSPAEYSRFTGLSLATVNRYLADGRLSKFQPGGKKGRVLIPRPKLTDTATLATTSAMPSPSAPAEPQTITRVQSGAGPRWMARRINHED